MESLHFRFLFSDFFLRMENASVQRYYDFGDFRFEAGHLMLSRAGAEVPLSPKAAQTLLALLDRHDQIVTKEELLQTVWPDSFVEESNLFRYLHVLRKTLGENESGKPFIETLHRRGFRFNGDVSSSQKPPTPRSNSTPGNGGGDSSRKKAIAILPFKNLTGNPRFQYYEFSLADAVITELAHSRSVIVRPSSVVARYLQSNVDPLAAGQEMLVDLVLTAGFVCSKGRIRLNAQLLDVQTEDVIWSDSIDSSTRDIFALQDTITRRISGGLNFDPSLNKHQAGGPTLTSNEEAYDEYLRGRDWLGRFMFRTLLPADCETAILHFKKATELDPQFALAWSGLGACYANRVFKGSGSQSDVIHGMAALDKALMFDSKIAETHVLMGLLCLSDGNKNRSRQELSFLENEFADDPATYYLKAVLSRLDGAYQVSLESWNELERLDPSAIVICGCHRARIYCFQGRIGRAHKELDAAAAAEPNHPFVGVFRAQVLFYSGAVREAIKLMRSILNENPHLDGVRPLLAAFYAAQNEVENAYSNLSKYAISLAMVDHDGAYWTACTYALLQDKASAFEWLERAVQLGLADRHLIGSDRSFYGLHDDKRFEAILDQIGSQSFRKRRKS